ncbi:MULTISPECIES: outer membrane protein transport protein [Pseudoalteromonas]|jgi:long-chain fatty acid transport protein|uniref:outer membrane protein transport protein n=1 Tax=Pseudoalteromonas TaxID=53246 RepID=UPI001194EF87|nr:MULTISPECIES: outer membrane protein transport protein [Pseudoalteromonas]MBB1275468.1 outer membrane protein transport protein [Pseudoalteromonas sp. SR43-3]MBB1280992.1 outer membrane protein transport protein [Pseudoalteromonas sp. SR41-1]MBB1296643.1 outer membrane protein transport protein [Pseudoalteromonas sp. SR41-7]MBB1306841.1 outer membrane protein transport protein [Pseudoalteromonas sp. SR43-5]MBB1325282.1 outer membrane protein transport protein [Pseudoalteromonas sp. SR45-1]|tara:strand:+ start:506 stop:1774 length:1269 start_codon:yes stop_codon:yes gene_type:complete
MKFSKTLIAASLAFVSADSFAAAFQLSEQNASGLGRAYAGEASIADDASVVARNPALMTLFKDKQLSVAAIGVIPDVSIEGESTNNGIDPSALDDDSIAPSAVVPAVYFTMPYNDKVSIGFGAFSNFGLSTEFNDEYVAGQIAGETEIFTVNLNASVAYKVTEQFSFGIGLNAIYADATVIRKVGANASGIDFGADAVNLQGDDTGFGLNVGLMYQLDDNSRFGFNYRSETDITFDGDFSNDLPAAIGGTGGAKLPGAVDLTLPAIAEFSGSHQLDDKLGLHYSVLWTGWSSFESLEAQVTLPTGDKFVAFEKQEQFDDSFRYSVGADYQYNEDLLLRAGVAFDESPVSQTHLSISIPDTDRFWFSFGGNYTIDQNSNVDLGVSIIRGKTQTFTEADDSGSQWGFESKGHAVLLGAQYNYKF